MGDLLNDLRKRADANALAELDVYEHVFPEHRALAGDRRSRAETLDYAVWFRRRTVELAQESHQLTDEDLRHIGAIGKRRAEGGFSTGAVQRALVLHAKLMLGEIQAAAEGTDLGELLHLVTWIGAQTPRGSAAYLDGYVAVRRRRLSVRRRLHELVDLVLAGDLLAPSLARDLGVRLHDHYVVVVLRFPGRPPGSEDDADDLVESVFKAHTVPIAWRRSDELLALLPWQDLGAPSDREGKWAGALSVVRDIAGKVDGACRVGASTGGAGALGEAVALARQVVDVAPLERIPRALYGLEDVFVELGVVGVPEVEQWLGDVARRLVDHPDLVKTLDAYYRHDMKRLPAAVALHIHPRTLDYRLRRAREVVEFDPSSVKGVRVLTAAVSRLLAGAPS
ncbi:PucR family transcriptional regulator [Amycolatopsis thailandensis]|uniref:PucR family transcriptional regulator n=1 Tax=Amycolatopsis thailandensis TaxID=589330 RepID=UPI0037ADE74C